MSLREGPFGDIKPPVKWTAAGALALAIILALGLFAMARRAEGLAGRAREAVYDVEAPAGEVLSAPIRWAQAASSTVADYLFAGSENARLKRELKAMGRWRDAAIALQEENARYRALMGVKTDPPIPMVFARTVLDARGPFANTRLADVGSDRGVTEGNPVLSDHGLVGRVLGVSRTASRILLLTDPDSRTPVLMPRTNARAILTGDGGANPKLAYLRSHDPVKTGDLVLTSGDGGVFPRGLPVGVAYPAGDGWRVVLDADSAAIDYVRILLFHDFSQLIAPNALAPTAMPSAMTEEPAQSIIGAPPPASPPARASYDSPSPGGKAEPPRSAR